MGKDIQGGIVKCFMIILCYEDFYIKWGYKMRLKYKNEISTGIDMKDYFLRETTRSRIACRRYSHYMFLYLWSIYVFIFLSICICVYEKKSGSICLLGNRKDFYFVKWGGVFFVCFCLVFALFALYKKFVLLW